MNRPPTSRGNPERKVTKTQLPNDEIARNVIALRDELARATLGREPSDPSVKMALLLNDCIYGQGEPPGAIAATSECPQTATTKPRWQRILELEEQARGVRSPPGATPEQAREARNSRNLEVIATKARIDLYAPGIALLIMIALAWWILRR